MSIPADLGDLGAAVEARGGAVYLLTVTESGAPHVVHAAVTVSAEGLVATVGEHTALDARARPRVSLLHPARYPGDYSLIVDALATVRAGADGLRLVLAPTRAVLHRPSPAPTPCGSDCLPLSLGRSEPRRPE